jgi:lipopolysaccharide transport system ATP-binding protein
VRLAFAVAAHLDPEILVVDEVLAVGDAAFQKKCLGKMGDVAKEGRTVLFVSHNMGAISSLTNRAILLNGGMIQFNGNTNQAVHEYLSTTYHHGTEWHRNERTNNPMEIIRAKVTSDGIDESNEFDVLKDILVSVEYVVRQPVRGAVIAVILHAWDGAMLFSTEDTDTIPELLFIRETGYYSCVVTIPGGWLNKGDYHIRLGCGIPYQQNFDNIEAFHFTLIDTGNQLSRGHRTGAYLLPTLNWDVKHTSTPVDVTLP